LVDRISQNAPRPPVLLRPLTSVGERSSGSPGGIPRTATTCSMTAATSAHRSGRRLGTAAWKKNVRSSLPSGRSSAEGVARKPRCSVTSCPI
jgi:hypothetical protein